MNFSTVVNLYFFVFYTAFIATIFVDLPISKLFMFIYIIISLSILFYQKLYKMYNYYFIIVISIVILYGSINYVINSNDIKIISFFYVASYIIYILSIYGTNPINSINLQKKIMKKFIFFSLPIVILSFFTILLKGEFNLFNLFSYTNSFSKNMIGLLLFIVFVFSKQLYLLTKKKKYILLSFIYFFSALLTTSRGIYLIILFWSIYEIVILKKVKYLLIIPILAMIFFIVPDNNHIKVDFLDKYDRTTMLFNNNLNKNKKEDHDFMRKALLGSTLLLIIENPITGVGIGNQSEAIKSKLDELNFLTHSQIEYLIGKGYGGHNNLIRFFNDFGIPLGLLMILFFLKILKKINMFKENYKINKCKKYYLLYRNYSYLFGCIILFSLTNDVLLSSIFFIFFIFFIKISPNKLLNKKDLQCSIIR